MARGGRFEFIINTAEFERKLATAVTRVERGTKKATRVALEEIAADSLNDVPRDTDTLASSLYTRIDGSYKNFTGEIGYGGNGDPINPNTGLRASQYMIRDHEDLSAIHTTGKAKFLEDPINRYKAKFLPGAAMAVRSELE